MVVKFGIGFGYRNFLLVLFDWYYPHLYNYLQRFQKCARNK